MVNYRICRVGDVWIPAALALPGRDDGPFRGVRWCTVPAERVGKDDTRVFVPRRDAGRTHHPVRSPPHRVSLTWPFLLVRADPDEDPSGELLGEVVGPEHLWFGEQCEVVGQEGSGDHGRGDLGRGRPINLVPVAGPIEQYADLVDAWPQEILPVQVEWCRVAGDLSHRPHEDRRLGPGLR